MGLNGAVPQAWFGALIVVAAAGALACRRPSPDRSGSSLEERVDDRREVVAGLGGGQHAGEPTGTHALNGGRELDSDGHGFECVVDGSVALARAYDLCDVVDPTLAERGDRGPEGQVEDGAVAELPQAAEFVRTDSSS